MDTLESSNPSALIISPGPGRPQQSGATPDIVTWAIKRRCPLLGVCLGHQAIGEYFGASVVRAETTLHGYSSPIEHDGQGVFRGLSNPLDVGRYHSLVVDEESLSSEIKVSARNSEGEVMGLRHPYLPIEGVQFHPESVLTPAGRQLLANFAYAI